MKKVLSVLVIITIFSMVFSFIVPNITYAKVKEVNVNTYKPTGTDAEDTKALNDKAGKILGIISVVGTIVSVVALIAIGIKYMLGSIEEKAEYKKDFIPYIIGAILVFAGAQVPQFIYNIMKSFK